MPHTIKINPGVPAIPDIAVDDQNLQQGYDALKEAVELLAGVRGDPLNRALTVGEATEDGQTELFQTNITLANAAASQDSVRLAGDVAGTGLFDGNGAVVVPTALQLPNIIRIDGGAPGTNYASQIAGPYGIENVPTGGTTGQVLGKLSNVDGDYDWINQSGGGGGGVPNGGTAGQLLIKQSATNGDAIWATWGPAPANAIYCPGYPYTFVSTTQFRVNGYDVSNLFQTARRCQFTDGASTYFGQVLSSSYNGANTTINMDMEGTDVLTATISEVCLATDGTGWTPIAGDPFSGTAINYITSGNIGATVYWVAVGNNGRLCYSTDAGVTWTIATTGTTTNYEQVAYNPASQTFIAVGSGGVVTRSTNGTTWSSTTPLSALITSGPGDIRGIAYWEPILDNWILYHQTTSAGAVATAVSTDDGVTWSLGVGQVGVIGNYHMPFVVRRTTGQAFLAVMVGLSEDIYQISTPTGSMAVVYNTSGQGNARAGASIHFDGLTNDVFAKNHLIKSTAVLDDATLPITTINAMAWSITHSRLVVVANDGAIGTYEAADVDNSVGDFLELQSNGGNPLADYLSVHFDETDGVFIAGNSQGQLVRSTNGLGTPKDTILHSGWTLSAADPFSGASITRVMSGQIGSTVYWVIIGTGGKLYTSTDKGVSWTQRTTNTTENLLSIGYNPTNQQFLVGCTNGEFLYSSNGTTWTRDNTTVAALAITGSNDIRAVVYSAIDSLWWVAFVSTVAATTCRTWSVSPAAMTTWTSRDTGVSVAPDGMARMNPAQNQIIWPQQPTAVETSFHNGATDTTDSAFSSTGSTHGRTTAVGMAVGTGGFLSDVIIGKELGGVKRYGSNGGGGTARGRVTTGSDTLTTVKINGIAYGSTPARWTLVCDSGEIWSLPQSSFDVGRNAFEGVTNPFTLNINDVWYDVNDGIFMAVGSNGQIGTSTDGIS